MAELPTLEQVQNFVETIERKAREKGKIYGVGENFHHFAIHNDRVFVFFTNSDGSGPFRIMLTKKRIYG